MFIFRLETKNEIQEVQYVRIGLDAFYSSRRIVDL